MNTEALRQFKPSNSSKKSEDGNVVTSSRHSKNRFSMLYQLSKHKLWLSQLCPRRQSQYLEIQSRIKDTTTKMLAVVENMARKIRPGDEESGVESDDDSVGDNVELKEMTLREIDDVSGYQLEVDVAKAIEII